MNTAQTSASLDQMFVSLSDANRRAMVERLCRHPASVKELAEPVGMGLPSALKHLRLLEDSGIVVSSKQGRVRTYRIRPGAFHTLNTWVLQRQAAMSAAFDRLEEALAQVPEDTQL